MRYALMLPFALAACVGAAEAPMVSDFNGHTVKVVYHPYALGAEYRSSPAYAKAKETCGASSDPSYQGVRRLNDYQGEHVFLCQ